MAVFDLSSWGWGGLFPWLAASGGSAKLSDPAGPDRPRDMTVDGALQISTVFACIRLLSETVGTLPCGAYVKAGNGRSRERYTRGTLGGLVSDSPNADMSSEEFWEAAVAYLAAAGNFLAEKVTLGGQVVALNIVHGSFSVRRKNGRRVYTFTNTAKERRVDVDEDEVFHVRGFGFGRDKGMSPIGYATQSLRDTQDVNSSASNAIRRGVTGAGFLEVPGKLGDAAQRKALVDTFVEPLTGVNGSRRAGVLEQGMTWKPLDLVNAEELQLLETKGFNVEELCRWFGVPPFMVGHTSKSTSWGTGLEQMNLGFLTYGLRPYLIRIAAAARKQLLTAAERAAGVYVEFNVDGLLMADSAGRAAMYAAGAQNGYMTRAEIREKENLPFIPGSDALTVQVNLTPLDQLGAPAQVADAAAKASFLNWLGIVPPPLGEERLLLGPPRLDDPA